MVKRILPTLAGILLAPAVWALDPFADPIPPGSVTARIVDYATVPDASPGLPPRLSVLTGDPTGRLFVNDQTGALYRLPASGGEAIIYLDLRDYAANPVVSTAEAGFQSFAFHPDFARSGTTGYGRFYTMHSTSNTNPTPDFDPGGGSSFHSVLLEWHTDEPLAGTFIAPVKGAPFREVLRFDQPFGNHNAGLIAFNPSVPSNSTDFGRLYIAIGDGGAGGDPQGNGQNLGNPYGALLRIDPLGSDSANGRYGIVKDNVFASDPEAAGTLAEIYAGGFRNPQRFTWDPADGRLFVADIGQNAVEEIDLAVNGGNFGWNKREGSFPFGGDDTTGLIGPVAEYDHTRIVSDLANATGSRAITAGDVARASGVPGLDGMLLLGDIPTGLIFTLDVDNDPLAGGQQGLRELQLVSEQFHPVRLIDLVNERRAARGLGATNRADLRFGVSTDGDIFVLNKHDGIVRKLMAVPVPPVVAMLTPALVNEIRRR